MNRVEEKTSDPGGPGTRWGRGRGLALASLVTGCLVAFTLPAGMAQGSYVHFEAKQTAPIRISPDGTRLFAVNTPDARVSVFDLTRPLDPVLIAEIPVGLEPVSVHPRNRDEAWVVNEVSDSLTIVSVSAYGVIGTICVPDEPADVVFAGGRAWVTAARRNGMAVIDIGSRQVLTNLTLRGENPRALAVSPTGDRVYAAFCLSGNRTTVVPPEAAPAPPAPTNPDLPPAPQVSLIVDAADPNWSQGRNAPIRYTMPDHDVVEVDAATLEVVRYFSGVGTVLMGLTVHPVSGDLWVANTEARNLVPFEPNLRGVFQSNRVSRIQVGGGTVTHFDLNPGFTYAGFPNQAERSRALAQPTALVWEPDGRHLYVAAFGSDRVGRLDAQGQVTARIELHPETAEGENPSRTKRGPRGLALLPGQALYVMNRLANTLSIIDVTEQTVAREIPVGSHDPTPDFIRAGRGFLYDAGLSGSGTVSCASCHIDGEMDMLAWDLGDPGGQLVTNRTQLAPGTPALTSVFHPMKGPMVTQTLRGLKDLEPLHWRGDRTNFLHFNGAFDSLLGGGLLSQDDMILFRAFINTLGFQPNPNQNLDRTLPTAFPTRNGLGNAERGRQIFINDAYQPSLGLTCNTCHALPTGSARIIVPAAALQESQDFKVPHLRNLYQKLNVNFAPGAQSVGGYGIIHDGIDPDLFTFLSRPVFGVFANDPAIKRDLDAFVQCFDTGTAPAVGLIQSLDHTNLEEPAGRLTWALLENQALVRTNIDLIAQGTLDGARHGLLFDPATGRYQTDQTGWGPFSRADLEAKIQAGGSLTLLGVPPGSGPRMGLDRDQDGILNADEPAPSLQIVHSETGVTVSWPADADAPGFVLEQAVGNPAGPWEPDVGERALVNGRITVNRRLESTSLFFRLRSL